MRVNASVFAVLMLMGSLQAQLPAWMEECLPIPSYGRELKAYEQSLAKKRASNDSEPSVRVDLTIVNSALSLDGQKALIRQVGEVSELEGWKDLVSEMVMFAFQREGYFKVEVELVQDPQKPTADNLAKVQRIKVKARVREGHHFRLGEIRFRGQTAFREKELRPLFPLSRGDTFNTEKIREGLEGLRKLYGGKGYINFTPVPDTFIDESNRTISLDIDIDEGAVYHVGEIRALGLEEELVKRVVDGAELKPGAVFNGENIEDLVRRFNNLLPKGKRSDGDSETIRDDRNHTVTLILDFRRCPK